MQLCKIFELNVLFFVANTFLHIFTTALFHEGSKPTGRNSFQFTKDYNQVASIFNKIEG